MTSSQLYNGEKEPKNPPKNQLIFSVLFSPIKVCGFVFQMYLGFAFGFVGYFFGGEVLGLFGLVWFFYSTVSTKLNFAHLIFRRCHSC